MIRNNWDRISQNDRRFETAIRILRVGIVAMLALPVAYFIVCMLEADSFSTAYLFAILGIIVFGILLWTLLDIRVSYFVDIKFIRNSLQKLMENVKKNSPEEPTDQNGYPLEYNPIRENPTSHIEYPDQKRPPNNF